MELSAHEGKVCLLGWNAPAMERKVRFFGRKVSFLEMEVSFLEMEVSFLEMEVSFLEMEVSFLEMEVSFPVPTAPDRVGESENMKWNAPFPCATFLFLEMKDPFPEEELPFLEMEASFPEMEHSISSFEAFHSQAGMAKARFSLKNGGLQISCRFERFYTFEVVIFPLSAADALARASVRARDISSTVLVCSRAAPSV
jgi:hypothetical protein